MAELPRVYLDSNCYIAILREERAFLDDLRRIIQEAEEGRLQIVASTLCISEVVRPKSDPVIPRAESEEKIRRFFRPPHFLIRTHDRFIAEQGRDLCWDYKLHPRDAIHVASAVDTGCRVLMTADEKVVKRCRRMKTPLPIEVKLPKWTGQLTIEDFGG